MLKKIIRALKKLYWDYYATNEEYARRIGVSTVRLLRMYIFLLMEVLTLHVLGFLISICLVKSRYVVRHI